MDDPKSAKPWWYAGLKFECLGCGRCCRGEPGAIWFTEEEERMLAARIAPSLEAFRRRYVTGRYGRPSIVERANGECRLLDGATGRCTVYSLRPRQCRLFPFWPSLLASPRAWMEESRRCPGMNQGKEYSGEEIAALLATTPFRDL